MLDYLTDDVNNSVIRRHGVTLMRGSYFHTFQNIHIYSVSKWMENRRYDCFVLQEKTLIVWCMCASRNLQETCKVWCTQETHDQSRVRSLSKSVCETSSAVPTMAKCMVEGEIKKAN